jgi:hypothetical protein
MNIREVLRNAKYSYAFQSVLSNDDEEFQTFLKSIYFQIPYVKLLADKEKSFQKWYESFKENETYENFVQKLEVFGEETLKNLERILKKHLPFQVKLVQVIRFIPLIS